jgi:hypothetical protein
VDALVHQCAAAVELPRPLPVRGFVVTLSAPPFDICAAEGEPAKAARLDRLLQQLRPSTKPVLKYTG